MNKRKYLRQLRKALGRIPEKEKEELVEYYAEIIDESYERGKTAREIFATIETPKQVAANYFNESEGAVREERRRPFREEYEPRKRGYGDLPQQHDVREECACAPRPLRKRRSIALTLLLFPLYLVGFVLALAAGIVCAALVLCSVGLVLGGLYTLVVSFGLFPEHGTLAVTQIGAAVLLFGVAVLFELAIKPLASISGALFRTVFGARRRERALVQTHWIGVLVAGAVLLLIGGAMGGFGFRALGNDWHNLAIVGNIAEREQTVDLSSENLSLVSDNLRVTVQPAPEGEGAKLVYYESEELPLEYSAEDGVISLQCGEWGNREYWKQTFRRGLLFPAVISDTVRAELYLPADYTGNITCAIDNGSLALGGFGEETKFAEVSLSTDNGMITVNGFNAQTLSLDTDNGYIKLESVCADTVEFQADNGAVKLSGIKAQTVSGITHNGAIRLEKLESGNVALTTHNGAITGTLVGSEEEFKIEAEVSRGSCNLKNRLEGINRLFVKTSNGAIDLHFVQE